MSASHLPRGADGDTLYRRPPTYTVYGVTYDVPAAPAPATAPARSVLHRPQALAITCAAVVVSLAGSVGVGALIAHLFGL